MRILITGGAGYIGSYTAKELAKAGHEPVVLDNLWRGRRQAVRWGPLLEMDLSDRQALRRALLEYEISAVVHFAAFAYVGESMQMPADYFRNNVVNTLNLLDAMRDALVNRIVFSSTCASYGNPERCPMTEDHPQKPVNPYEEPKLMVERILAWYGQAYRFSWVALRYFNAASADPQGEIGELHHPETHLIPRAIAAACGDLPEWEVFGTDYETADGTAVRDYVHVTDLAVAHRKALQRLERGGPSGAMNLGTGRGCSVREVITEVEHFAGRRVPIKYCPRRAGDPAALVADPSRAFRELGWLPHYSSLEQIIETAWRWYAAHRRHDTAFSLAPSSLTHCRIGALVGS